MNSIEFSGIIFHSKPDPTKKKKRQTLKISNAPGLAVVVFLVAGFQQRFVQTVGAGEEHDVE